MRGHLAEVEASLGVSSRRVALLRRHPRINDIGVFVAGYDESLCGTDHVDVEVTGSPTAVPRSAQSTQIVRNFSRFGVIKPPHRTGGAWIDSRCAGFDVDLLHDAIVQKPRRTGLWRFVGVGETQRIPCPLLRELPRPT